MQPTKSIALDAVLNRHARRREEALGKSIDRHEGQSGPDVTQPEDDPEILKAAITGDLAQIVAQARDLFPGFDVTLILTDKRRTDPNGNPMTHFGSTAARPVSIQSLKSIVAKLGG